MQTLPPAAQRGRPVRQAWDKMLVWARSARLMPGLNVRLTRTAVGTIINFDPPTAVFRGAFAVSLADNKVRVGLGLVSGTEPKIGNKPISDPEALLKIGDKYDEEGRSWIVVRAKPDKDGKIEAKDALVIAQTDDPRTQAGPEGAWQHPLAVLVRDPKQPQSTPRVEQIEYFHLRLAKNGGGRFFFLPSP
jgi:hypothetical protein